MAPGPGKDTTFKACGDCHAIDQALGLRRSRPEWIAMIDKMVSQGASIKDEDYDGILAYLSGNYGKAIRINDVTAADLRSLLDISAAEATAIVTYRTDKGKFASFDELAKVPGINVTRITEEKQNFVFTSGS
jgi:competence protein ComEA